MENKICVYAICKNEMKFVQKWLDSMSEADYIVVLDTGSTDGTYEFLQNDSRVTIVKQKIYKTFRFDVARNDSMKLVPKDANILVCTDFDELFEPGWVNVIRQYWTEDTWRGHYTYVWSHKPNGNPGDIFWYDKFHNRKYKWVYPVHEVLLPENGIEGLNEEKNGHLIDFGNSIVLHHYPDNTVSRKFYFDLLKLRIKEFPNDAYSHFLLGREYGVNEDYVNAVKYFESALATEEIKDRPLVEYCALGYLADIFKVNYDYPNAIFYYMKQIVKDSSYREPYINIAEIYCSLGLYKIAEQFIIQGLTQTHKHYDWTERAAEWNEKPYDLLSIIYLNTNEYQKGLENALKALQIVPMDERIQRNYLILLQKLNEQSCC